MQKLKKKKKKELEKKKKRYNIVVLESFNSSVEYL